MKAFDFSGSTDSDFFDQLLSACLELWQSAHINSLKEEESSAAIENLLQCSRNLDLGDYMTPVQVWDLVRSLPLLADINTATMGHFTAELCKHTKRHRSVTHATMVQILISEPAPVLF